MNLSRRGFLSGLVAAAVAPAIIRTPGLIMPIKPGLVTQQCGLITFDGEGIRAGDTISFEGVNGVPNKSIWFVSWNTEVMEKMFHPEVVSLTHRHSITAKAWRYYNLGLRA